MLNFQLILIFYPKNVKQKDNSEKFAIKSTDQGAIPKIAFNAVFFSSFQFSFNLIEKSSKRLVLIGKEG